eukprot:3924235-Amphidinium_carterae.2
MSTLTDTIHTNDEAHTGIAQSGDAADTTGSSEMNVQNKQQDNSAGVAAAAETGTMGATKPQAGGADIPGAPSENFSNLAERVMENGFLSRSQFASGFTTQTMQATWPLHSNIKRDSLGPQSGPTPCVGPVATAASNARGLDRGDETACETRGETD